MIVVRRDIVAEYFRVHARRDRDGAARRAYAAWLAVAERAAWLTPPDVRHCHPKASILKGGRVVFNIKGNDFRLVAQINYRAGTVEIRFFGSHGEYDDVDAETV
jgi:mRNA interferase HigB